MYWVDRLKSFLRQPARTFLGEGLRYFMRGLICVLFWASVAVPWAGAMHLIKSHGRPPSSTYNYMTGILFGVCLLGLLYVLRMVVPMMRHYPRLIEDQGRCFYYWRRTLPLLAVLTLVTAVKFLNAVSR